MNFLSRLDAGNFLVLGVNRDQIRTDQIGRLRFRGKLDVRFFCNELHGSGAAARKVLAFLVALAIRNSRAKVH